MKDKINKNPNESTVDGKPSLVAGDISLPSLWFMLISGALIGTALRVLFRSIDELSIGRMTTFGIQSIWYLMTIRKYNFERGDKFARLVNSVLLFIIVVFPFRLLMEDHELLMSHRTELVLFSIIITITWPLAFFMLSRKRADKERALQSDGASAPSEEFFGQISTVAKIKDFYESLTGTSWYISNFGQEMPDRRGDSNCYKHSSKVTKKSPAEGNEIATVRLEVLCGEIDAMRNQLSLGLKTHGGATDEIREEYSEFIDTYIDKYDSLDEIYAMPRGIEMLIEDQESYNKALNQYIDGRSYLEIVFNSAIARDKIRQDIETTLANERKLETERREREEAREKIKSKMNFL